MNIYGMIYHKIHDKAITEAANINPILILYNATIYHYWGLQELNLNIVYLPPYSPLFNPIENVFSVWKNLVLQGGTWSEVQLKNLISS